MWKMAGTKREAYEIMVSITENMIDRTEKELNRLQGDLLNWERKAVSCEEK